MTARAVAALAIVAVAGVGCTSSRPAGSAASAGGLAIGSAAATAAIGSAAATAAIGSAAATAAIGSAAAATVPELPATSRPARPVTSQTSRSAFPRTPTVPSRPSPSTETSQPSTSSTAYSTCGSLTTRVIRGSGSAGREFAALQFTNGGTAACTLVGYPTVTLLLRGSQIGTPSTPASTRASRISLAPGATAQSLLDVDTDCSAPLSDSLRVVAPGSSRPPVRAGDRPAVRPAQLRACAMRAGALGPPG